MSDEIQSLVFQTGGCEDMLATFPSTKTYSSTSLLLFKNLNHKFLLVLTQNH